MVRATVVIWLSRTHCASPQPFSRPSRAAHQPIGGVRTTQYYNNNCALAIFRLIKNNEIKKMDVSTDRRNECFTIPPTFDTVDQVVVVRVKRLNSEASS